MRTLPYHLVDVFTDRQFGGNQLAVFPDAGGLSTETMQSLAKELNLSETTFVFPPQDAQNTALVRIFTPATEVPMAGHPTIGTTFILAREGRLDLSSADVEIRLEEGVGVIPVKVQLKGKQVHLITMTQPLPSFGNVFPDPSAIAEVLSISPTDIDACATPQVVSCGVAFLFVPLKGLPAVRRVRLRLDLWENILSDFEAPHIFVFTRETEHRKSTVHCRMFAPALGIVEDPATGAASGPLGCYLVKHNLVSSRGHGKIISEQGFEMGRPSIIHIEIEHKGENISGVHVGGECVYVGQGVIELNEND